MRCFCGVRENKLLFYAGAYSIVQCEICGQVRTITPSHVTRKQIYTAEDISVYLNKEEMFRKIFRRILDFIKQYKSKGTLVEIGAGVGLLVDEACRVGFNSSGIEPSRAAVRAAKRYFGINLRASKFSRRTLSKRVDIIVLNHVLEHLSNPKSVINILDKRLAEDGLFVIGVPNFNSIISKIKRGRWQNLIPDQHRWHFTLETLDQLVLPFGFVRRNFFMENHDRSMHYIWKRPIYWMLDTLALLTNKGEAMLVVYQKI